MGSDSLTVRSATLADVPIIIAHRHEMFAEMQRGTPGQLRAMDRAFRPWIERALHSGIYLGWFVADRDRVAAGAGLLLEDWPATPMDQSARRGYILNVYTHPDYRRRGLARKLMRTILDYCRLHDIRIVSLHASAAGRALYESLGFRPTNEMRLNLAEENG